MVPLHFRRFTISGADHQAMGIPICYFSCVIMDFRDNVLNLTSRNISRDAVIIKKVPPSSYFKGFGSNLGDHAKNIQLSRECRSNAIQTVVHVVKIQRVH